MNAKETFITSPDAKPFADMAASPVFERALQYALLCFVENQSRHPNPLEYDPAAALQGALRFKETLENLWKPIENQATPYKEEFNYKVYERNRRSTNT